MRMIPIEVTAITPGGFLTYEPWTPALDGILAYSLERERLGSDFGANLDVRPVDNLPLEKTEWNGSWWYQCSLPKFDVTAQKEKHFVRRFDAQEAADRVPSKNKIVTSMGRHKNIRKARLISVGGSVSWSAVGDPDEVRRLLADIPNVGGGWSRGFGKVTKWIVQEVSGAINRPVPIEYAMEHGIQGFEAKIGFRPPAWLPDNQAVCIIPNIN